MPRAARKYRCNRRFGLDKMVERLAAIATQIAPQLRHRRNGYDG
jgi:hypothetical protein